MKMIRLAIIVGIVACCVESFKLVPIRDHDEGFLNISPFHEDLKKELMAAIATKHNEKVTLPVSIYRVEAKIVQRGLQYHVFFVTGSNNKICEATWTDRIRSKTPENVKLKCLKIFDFGEWAGNLDYHSGIMESEDF
uniref:Myb-like protein L n=1 Tax=Lygus hesperus TaxID=30085 RepID=A0A0A9X6V9_LYGHE